MSWFLQKSEQAWLGSSAQHLIKSKSKYSLGWFLTKGSGEESPSKLIHTVNQIQFFLLQTVNLYFLVCFQGVWAGAGVLLVFAPGGIPSHTFQVAPFKNSWPSPPHTSDLSDFSCCISLTPAEESFLLLRACMIRLGSPR